MKWKKNISKRIPDYELKISTVRKDGKLRVESTMKKSRKKKQVQFKSLDVGGENWNDNVFQQRDKIGNLKKVEFKNEALKQIILKNKKDKKQEYHLKTNFNSLKKNRRQLSPGKKNQQLKNFSLKSMSVGLRKLSNTAEEGLKRFENTMSKITNYKKKSKNRRIEWLNRRERLSKSLPKSLNRKVNSGKREKNRKNVSNSIKEIFSDNKRKSISGFFKPRSRRNSKHLMKKIHRNPESLSLKRKGARPKLKSKSRRKNVSISITRNLDMKRDIEKNFETR